MKKRKIFIYLIILCLLINLSSCNKKSSYNLEGKTFYNIIDEYGNNDHSKIWFGSDKSFVFKDNYSEGFYELNGKWSLKENVITLDIENENNFKYTKVIFEIKDNETIILKSNLTGSKFDATFSINEIKGSEINNNNNNNNNTTNINYGTFYALGQDNKSYIEIRNDNSITIVDTNGLGISELNGTYKITDDYIILESCSGVNPFEANIIGSKIFRIKDKDNIVLQKTLGVSFEGDVFSTSKPTTINNNIPCQELKIDQKSYWAIEGVKDWDIGIKAIPENTTDKIYYKSNDEKVVTIDSLGRVSAIAPGKTTIEATCGNAKLTIEFETKPKAVGVDKISINPNKVSLYLNNSLDLNIEITPSNATDKGLSFSSSDTSVVKVDNNGKITGLLPGVAQVTVTAVNGKKATVDVCVEGETVIYEMANNITLKEASGEKAPYKATYYTCYDWHVKKEDVTKEVSFHTAYTSALDIDGNGNVYAKGSIYETTDIPFYFSFNDGSSLNVKSQEFKIRVVKQ